MNLELAQSVDDLGYAVFDLALLIGVLNAQEEHAAPALGEDSVQQSGVQSADVHKACGAGGKTGAHRPFRQIPGGIQGLSLLIGHLDIGEKCVGNTFAHAKVNSLS